MIPPNFRWGNRFGFTRPRVVGLTAMATAAVMVTLAMPAAATTSTGSTSSAADVTVSPAQGSPGGQLSLSGSALPAHRRILVLLDRARLVRVQTDRRGAWSSRARIPRRTALGTHLLRLQLGARQLIAARFSITRLDSRASTPSVLAALASGEQARLSPDRIAAGGKAARLSGTGFGRGEIIRLWLGNARLSTTRTSTRGAVNTLVSLPRSARTGLRTLTLSFGRKAITVPLTVLGATRYAGGSRPPAPAPSPAPTPAPPVPTSTTAPSSTTTTTSSTITTPPPPPPAPPLTSVVDAVGDMGCAPNDMTPGHQCQQQAVSNLVVNPFPNALLDLGDNQYDNGSLPNYNTVYGPTFGRANAVVYPSLGNAEYYTANAAGFFGYFGSSTGVFSRIQTDGGDNSHLTAGGYYSFNVGAWHLIALNSNCSNIGGCGAGSPEEQWLSADLAAHRGVCTLAYWHHPLWNSGSLGNDQSSPATGTSTAAFWSDLYAAHADIVLNGHGNHHYEQFLPQNPSGQPDPKGIREFIVSTGGQSHGTPPATPGDQNTSVVTNYTTFGILQLTLHPTSYDWHFIPAAGGTFTNGGTAACNL